MLDSVKGFGVTFSHMFKKTVTTKYPEKPDATKPRYHGRHILNRHPDGLEKCIGCELCAWACPADAIYVEGGDNTDELRFSPGERYASIYQINYARCIFCGLCIEACPTRSLTMSNEYELARDNRQDLRRHRAGGGPMMAFAAEAAGQVSTGEAWGFWILGPLAVIGGLGMVMS